MSPSCLSVNLVVPGAIETPSSADAAGDGLKPSGIGETLLEIGHKTIEPGVGAARLCNLVDERRPPLVPIEDVEVRADGGTGARNHV